MARKLKPKDEAIYFDYKDFKTLQRYIDQYGQIVSRKKSGLNETQQKHVAKAIKRARHIALLPYTSNG